MSTSSSARRSSRQMKCPKHGCADDIIKDVMDADQSHQHMISPFDDENSDEDFHADGDEEDDEVESNYPSPAMRESEDLYDSDDDDDAHPPKRLKSLKPAARDRNTTAGDHSQTSQGDYFVSTSQVIPSNVKTEKQRTRKAPSKQAAVSACSGSEDEATPALKASKEQQSVNVVQSDKYKYGEGINTEGRPFPRVEDMLKHMTKKAIEAKFGDVARHLQRPLKVATFCSGTDCPILGLDLFISALKSLRYDGEESADFSYEHCISAELVPWKQAYIQRNFKPHVIFRDITELSLPWTGENQTATTAYGGKAAVPGDIDILVAGFCCVDFSPLNRNKKTLKELGESGDTFHAILSYLEIHRPKILLLENVKGAPWSDLNSLHSQKTKLSKEQISKAKEKNTSLTKEEENNILNAHYITIKDEALDRGIDWHLAEVGYVARYLIVDTKSYYLPQTRERGYMVALPRKEFEKLYPAGTDDEVIDNAIEDALDTWQRLFKSFENPASVPVEVMLAAAADDAGPGLSRIEEVDEELKKVTQWVKCKAIHQKYREVCRLGNGRMLTFWRENGYRKLPDFWASMKGLTERVLDTLDSAHLRNVLRGFDDRFYGRFPELSQNVNRNQDTAKNGIIGCLTPTGIPFWTVGGRRLTGREALILQGLPVNLLDLSNLTEAHLQNFTGNAMSLTVVTSAVLSALIAFHPILPRGEGGMQLDKPAVESNFDEGHLIQKQVDPTKPAQMLSVKDAKTGAALTVSFCDCERRHDTLNKIFRRCKVCRHIRCDECGGNPAHHFDFINKTETSCREIPAKFEKLLSDSIPTKTRLESTLSPSAISDILREINEAQETKADSLLWKDLEDSYKAALSSEVFLQKVDRTGIWEVSYDSDNARVLLHVSGHEIEWLLYALPPPTHGLGHPLRVYLETHPIARLRPVGDDITQGNWQVWQPKERDINAIITGTGKLVPSFEASIGLPDFANTFVWDQCSFKLPAGGADAFEVDISGEYELSQACSQAWNSLHVQSSTKNSVDPMYFFLEHQNQRGNPQDHYFVFTQNPRRMKNGEHRQIIAHLSSSWRQPKIERQQTADGFVYNIEGSNQSFRTMVDATTSQEIKIRVEGSWISSSLSLARAESASIQFQQLPHELPSAANNSCERPISVLTCEATIPKEIASKYPKGEWVTVHQDNQANAFLAFRWMLQAGLAIDGHVVQLESWHESGTDCSAPRCQRCAPDRPPMLWAFKDSGKSSKQEPFEDPEKASKYELALKDRPQAITCMFYVGQDSKTKFQVVVNPETLIHRAVFDLVPHGNTENVTASSCLVTNDSLALNVPFLGFSIKNNRDITHFPDFPLPGKFQLRDEQCRSVAWQVKQEETPPTFIEEVIVEEKVAKIGYRLSGKASRPVEVHGGFLFHPVGFGKTAVMLGLIHNRQDADQDWARKQSSGTIHLKATLIFMSPQLCTQWQSEVKKFLGPKAEEQLIVIQTIAQLKSLSIEGMKKADLIIVNWRVCESEVYLANLAQFAGMVGPDSKASSRAKNVFYESTIPGVERNVDLLRSNPAGFEDTVRGQVRESFKKAQSHVLPVPSKRTTGAAYQPVASRSSEQFKKRPLKSNTSTKEVFTLKGPKPGQSYLKTKFLPLEAYSFARVSADEFPYMPVPMRVVLKMLKKNNLWLISATPGTDSFEEVREIATYYNVNLGVTDFSSMPGDVFRKATADMTDSEKFQIYESPRSPAWYQHRIDLAQRFLDMSARCDLANISEINQITHIVLAHPPAAQKAASTELMQCLANNNLDIPRIKYTNSNLDLQLQDAFSKSRSAHEAMMKQSCFFNNFADPALRKLLPSENATSPAVDITVQGRKNGYNGQKKYFEELLQKAEWLAQQPETATLPQYANFLSCVRNNSFGDPNCTAIMIESIDKAHSEWKNDDWAKFYFELPSGNIQAGGKSQVLLVHELRNCVAELSSCAEELVKRERSHRYMSSVASCQRECVALGEGITCDGCGGNKLRPMDVTLQSGCGHTVCKKRCLAKGADCQIEGCTATNMPYQKFSGDVFGFVELGARVSEFGQKGEDLISLIADKIPKEDKVLIFLQNELLIKNLQDLLESHNISHAYLGDSYASAKVLNGFQKGEENRKALILNIGSPSAAGCNLTIANHVIFYAPYFTTGSSGQAKWKAAMTQAIGRAARFGQKKDVNIYHFLTVGTIDVDILEHRTGKVIREGATANRGVFSDRQPGERAGRFASPISHLMFGGYED